MQLTLEIGSAITSAAALSFVGLGIVAPAPEWGCMLWAASREILKYAVIIVATVPILAVYPFLQKYFVKGIMAGSLKG